MTETAADSATGDTAETQITNDAPAEAVVSVTEVEVTEEQPKIEDSGDVVVTNTDAELPTNDAEPVQPASDDMLRGEDSEQAGDSTASTDNPK